LIQRLADQLQTIFTKTFAKEDAPILRTYKINHEQSVSTGSTTTEEKNFCQIGLTKRNAK
jgi:hypothetical protein